jgi:hypothetical protein
MIAHRFAISRVAIQALAVIYRPDAPPTKKVPQGSKGMSVIPLRLPPPSAAPAQPAVDELGDGFEKAVLVDALLVGEHGLEAGEPGFEDRDLVLERRQPCPNVRSSAVPSNPVSASPAPAGPARVASKGRKGAGRGLGLRQQVGEPRVDGPLRRHRSRCGQGAASGPPPGRWRQAFITQRIEAARQVERVERVSRRSPRLHGRVEEQSGKPETFENRLIRNPLSRQSVVDDRRREAQGDRRAVDMQVLGAVAQPQAIPPTPATKNRRGPRG